MLDLQNMGAYRENNRIEAKRATGGFPRSLWETYSAFANTIGGVILLGVEENPDKSLAVVGVPDSRGYQEEFWAHVRNTNQVSVNILASEDVFVQTVEGKEILVIQVPRAGRRDRPVFLGGNPFTGAYRRDGEGDYHCTPDEVRSMLRDRADTPVDLAPLTRYALDTLDWESLWEFRKLMALRNPGHPFTVLRDRAFLLSVGAAAQTEERLPANPTVAGLLLFGKLPYLKETFPRYKLEYREAMPGGTFIRSGEPGWQGNLFAFYCKVSQRLKVLVQDLAPEDQALEASIREAAVNAILHTDYFGGQGLSILRLPDALQVRNSGLPRIPPEAAGGGQMPDSRNQGLTRLFALIGVGTGTGIGLRGIYETWATKGWSTPRLSESFGPDTTSLRLPLRGLARDGLGQRILEYLTRAVSAEPLELARALDTPPLLVQKALSELMEEHLISRSREGGHRSYALRA